jgi:hypothetical protein
MSFAKEICGNLSHEQQLCVLLQQISFNMAPTNPGARLSNVLSYQTVPILAEVLILLPSCAFATYLHFIIKQTLPF